MFLFLLTQKRSAASARKCFHYRFLQPAGPPPTSGEWQEGSHASELWGFGWGAAQRAFIHGDLDTSPDFVTQGVGPCPDLSPDIVPALFTVCSYSTKNPQKTSNGVILIN